ncbi:hypothetical protein B5P43_18495 [Bacillus sp. SRB_336]|nr:hypothetical protein B5P43_18495 [Bacillus sp. SRB_336]
MAFAGSVWAWGTNGGFVYNDKPIFSTSSPNIYIYGTVHLETAASGNTSTGGLKFIVYGSLYFDRNLSINRVNATFGGKFYGQGYIHTIQQIISDSDPTSRIDLTNTTIGGCYSLDLRSSSVIVGTGSTINMNYSTSPAYVSGGGNSFGTVNLSATTTTITGSNSFNTLSFAAGTTTLFANSTTQTLTNFNAVGTSSSPVILQSSTSGSKFTLSKPSGTVDAYYINVQDSTVTGGATWNAHNSGDAGNNTGWNWLGPVVPTASFTAIPTTGRAPLSVAFTDTSVGVPTSWSWNFGDGSTSTSQNPSHTYSAPGTYTVILTATNSVGSNSKTQANFISATTTVISNLGGISSLEAFGTPTASPGAVTRAIGSIGTAESVGPVMVTPAVWPISGLGNIPTAAAFDLVPFVLTEAPPPPPPPTDWSVIGKEDKKVYIYKVYQANGTYIGVWTDVVDDLMYTQQINTPGTTTTVQLGRSADKLIEVRDTLITQDGLNIITGQDNDPIGIVYNSPNTVGAGTDVDLNYNVDVYVNYGGFDDLVTQLGEGITTQDGDGLLISYGAPLGTRIFSGFILDYTSTYGDQSGVTVTLSSNGYELGNAVIMSGAATTASYGSQPIESVVKSILNTNPGKMGYTTATIDTTGVSASFLFQLNTKLEGIQTSVDQTPDGWYWFGNVADNNVYLKNRSTTADHTFILGYHIKSLDVKRSMESLKNLVYFVGGDVTPGDDSTKLFKKYQDTVSQAAWRIGLDRHTDGRYTLATSTSLYATKLMARYAGPIYTTELIISSARYDIESIKLGQVVGFRNFDNFVDSLLLQIVGYSYSPYAITLQLGDILETQNQIVSDIQANLDNQIFITVPTTPS